MTDTCNSGSNYRRCRRLDKSMSAAFRAGLIHFGGTPAARLAAAQKVLSPCATDSRCIVGARDGRSLLTDKLVERWTTAPESQSSTSLSTPNWFGWSGSPGPSRQPTPAITSVWTLYSSVAGLQRPHPRVTAPRRPMIGAGRQDDLDTAGTGG